MTIELDPEYARVAAALKDAGVEPGDPLSLPLAEARAAQERYFAYLAQDPPAVESARDFEVNGPAGAFSIRMYYPRASRDAPVILYVRGGGWWAGTLDTHDRTMRLLANESGLNVCGIDYHRAPEHHYPTQLEELLAAIAWLREHAADAGVDAKRLVLFGESAGANLSVLAAVRLRSAAPQALSGLTLFYGNYAAPMPRGRPYSRWVWSQYLGSEDKRVNPDAVPLEADVGGLPPFWLAVGDADPLREDTLRFCEKLRMARVRCHLKRYPGMPHGFVMLNRLLPAAASAIAEAAAAAKAFVS